MLDGACREQGIKVASLLDVRRSPANSSLKCGNGGQEAKVEAGDGREEVRLSAGDGSEVDGMTAGNGSKVEDMTAGDGSKVEDMTAGDGSKVDGMTAGDGSEVEDIAAGDGSEVDGVTAGDGRKAEDMTAGGGSEERLLHLPLFAALLGRHSEVFAATLAADPASLSCQSEVWQVRTLWLFDVVVRRQYIFLIIGVREGHGQIIIC
jgi:hypothetical protein